MTPSPSIQPSRGLQILKIVLYVLAGLVLALGLVAGISILVSANHVVQNLLLPFQLMGNQAVSNLITPLVSGFMINLGVAVLVLTAIFSALLYGLGRLIGRVALLEARLARLEADPGKRI